MNLLPQPPGRRSSPLLLLGAALIGISGFPAAGTAHPFLDDRLVLLDHRIAAEPSNGQLFLSRGSLLLDERRAHTALADFERALELDSTLYVAHLLSAQALLADGRPDAAVAAARGYLELAPESSKGWRTLARALNARSTETGRSEASSTAESIAAFDRSIAFAADPSPDNFLERAALQRRAGRFDEAIRGLESGIARLGPLTALLRTALEIECERRAWAAALGYAERLVAASPQEERWQVERARLLMRLGRELEAGAALRDAEAALARRSPARRSAPALTELAQEIDRLESELAPRLAAAKSDR